MPTNPLDPLATSLQTTQIVLGVQDTSNGSVSITETNSRTLVIEGGATDTYTLRLNRRPTGNVTIVAAPDAQSSVAPATLIFTTDNFNTAQTVTLTAVDDDIQEPRHFTRITHNALSPDLSFNGTVGVLTATVLDNDTPAGVTIIESDGNTVVGEGGVGANETDTYTIALNRLPRANVILVTAPDAQTLTDPTFLTFTPENFDTPQRVTVRAFDDNQFEGNHRSVIRNVITEGDAEYRTLSIPNLIATVFDNNLFRPVPPPLTPPADLPAPTIPPQGTPGNDVITGSEGNDTINALAGDDLVFGLGGTDWIRGGKGADYIYGNPGRDLLDGEKGNDQLFGGRDEDTLRGGNGNDVLYGNQGNDTLEGGDGVDFLYGGQGDDVLNGAEGNDVLSGDFGRDLLIGGLGSDLFVLRQGTAVTSLSFADFIQDFQVGIDAIGLTGGLSAQNLTLEPFGKDTIVRIAGSNLILGVVVNVTPGPLQGSFIAATIGVI